ncbi:response regulator [candidate division KSB1 bacterium]
MRALIVDDDPDFRHLLKDLMTPKGINVDLAKDGLVGLLKAKREYYDIILLDIKMPSMDGEKVLNVLHKLKKTIPIIVISGYLTKELLLKLKEYGVKAFLTKPVNPEMIFQTINQVCGTDYTSD